VKFWIPLAIDAVIAAIVAFFLIWGLADGSVSTFNIGLWMLILGGIAVVVAGSLWLRSIGRAGLGAALALVLAIPGVFAGLFFLILIVGHPRWN